MPYRWIVPILCLSAFALALTVPHRSTDSLVSATQRPTTASRGPIVGVFPMPDPDEQYAIQTAVDAYLADQWAQVTAYLDALEQTRVAEEVAARRAAISVAPSGPPVLRQGGAPHSDAWWWGVAICEQGGRNDPYFGYFSWMDGSAAGLSWEEQVAKSNALLSRVSSESPAWAASCVAAGYRASPGG